MFKHLHALYFKLWICDPTGGEDWVSLWILHICSNYARCQTQQICAERHGCNWKISHDEGLLSSRKPRLKFSPHLFKVLIDKCSSEIISIQPVRCCPPGSIKLNHFINESCWAAEQSAACLQSNVYSRTTPIMSHSSLLAQLHCWSMIIEILC